MRRTDDSVTCAHDGPVCVEAGEGRLRVTLEAHPTGGHGLSGFLFGGTLPHVGGMALASPGAVIDGRRLSSCDLWTSTVPGHKDSLMAEQVARDLCIATGEPVALSAGIHVDDATAQELRTIAENCGIAVSRFLEAYRGGSAS